MKTHKPYTYVDEDGTRYLNIRQAAKIVGEVSEATLYAWARHGVSSFGFNLEVKSQPMIHSANGYRHEARRHFGSRLLIPEAKVLALKKILQTAGKNEPGPWSPEQMDRLEAVALAYQRRRSRQLTIKHL
jgi:hypothetical protein